MPRTLENHLVGVTADAPHPESYRPDLPLRSELSPSLLEEERQAELESEKESSYELGYDHGRLSARDSAREEVAAQLRALETENAELRAQQGERAS